MLILSVAVAVFALCGTKFAPWGEFYRDYHSPRKTNAVKGIFVLFVFASHVKNYLDLSGWDARAFWVVEYVGQLMVVPFLFWSGFGVMESIRRKGEAYVRSLPVNRGLRTLLHFDCALVLFLLVRFIIRRKVTPVQFLLSLVCWESIGNSNWFIFAILVLYLITTASFLLIRKNHWGAAAVTTLLTVAAMAVLSRFKEEHWYNTMLSYCLGMWFSLLRPRVERLLVCRRHWYLSWLTVSAAAFFLLQRLYSRLPFGYSLLGFAFMILLVMIAMKAAPDNRFLQFLGSYVFEIYILQRIPMRLLRSFHIASEQPAVFVLVCFGITCGLSVLFRRAMDGLDKRIFASRAKT